MKRITALVALTLYILATNASGAALPTLTAGNTCRLRVESDLGPSDTADGVAFRLPDPSPTGTGGGGGFGESRPASRPGSRYTPGGTLRKSPSMGLLHGAMPSAGTSRGPRQASVIQPAEPQGDSAAKLPADKLRAITYNVDPATRCVNICTYTTGLINNFLEQVTLNLETINTFLETNRLSTNLCLALAEITLGSGNTSTTADAQWPCGRLRTTCPRLINDLNDILLDLSDLRERLATCLTTASLQAAVQTATEKFITARILARDICIELKAASNDARATGNTRLEKLLFDAGHDLETTELADYATFEIGTYEVVKADAKKIVALA